MKKIFILFIFAVAFPVFSQDVKLSDTTMSQFWDSMSDEQKAAIIAEFVEIKLQYEKSKNPPKVEEKKNAPLPLPDNKQIEPTTSIASYYMAFNKLDGDEREDARHFVLSHSNDDDVLKQISKMGGSEKSIAQMYMSMNEYDKAAAKKWIYNEEEYYSARTKLKRGIVLSGIGVYVGSLSAILYENNRYSDSWSSEIWTGVGVLGMIAGGGLFHAGAPFVIIGAINVNKYSRYKPSFSISPNSLNFTMGF